jgi:hypothetical protein
MNVVLDFVKRYLFEILCGLGAAVGIALSLVGMGGMSAVTDEMNQAKMVKDQLHSLAVRPDPTNMKAVKQAQARIDEIRSTYKQVMDFVRQRNEYKPLIPDVFPDARNPKIRTDFQRAYREEVSGWLSLLKAGGVPSADAIVQERDRMEAEISGGELRGIPRKSGSEEDKDKPLAAENDARVRAAIRNAKELYCYADSDAFSVSYVSNRAGGPMYKEEPASLEDLWHAQLEVWVQRNVIGAIRAINDDAAEQIQARDGDNHPWVGNLPIKELVSLQTSTYYVTEGESSTGRTSGSAGRLYPPGNAAGVFTGNKSNPLFDPMQFTIQLIVDSRDIPQIISGLCAGNFHTPLRVSYQAVPANLSMQGKIYGDEPVVKLVVDFETVFFSELYLPLMPDKILEGLGKTRPEVAKAEGQ